MNPDFGFADKNVVPKTYNATGQIIPKKEPSPPKKTVAVEPAPKKVTTASSSNIPKVTKVEAPKKVQQVQSKEPKEDKSSPVRKEGGDKALQQKVKDLQEKMLMITEIVKSEEDHHMKIQLIADLLNINLATGEKHESPEP